MVFGMGMKNPKEYPNTVERNIENSVAVISIKTIESPVNYDVYRIEFQDETLYQHQLVNDKSFKVTSYDNILEITLAKEIVKSDNSLIYFFLYNKSTKKIEVYF